MRRNHVARAGVIGARVIGALAIGSALLPWSAQALPASLDGASQSTQVVDAAQMQAGARGALTLWLAAQHVRFDLEAVPSAAPLAVPAGRIELAARPVDAQQPLRSRMQVWVDIRTDGRFARSQPVAFRVHAYRPAWVANDDLSAGRDVSSAAFETREVDVAAADALPIDGPLPAARLRLRMAKGEPLTTRHLERLAAVQRGGSVTLRARLGEIGIESRGEALQDGQPGQRVWVKVATSTGPVLAQVVGDGLVEVSP